jgi:hypothetical protein
MEPDYKNKSQTAFAVSIICLGFVAETLNFARGNPRPGTVIVLSLLAAVGVGSVVMGVVWHRRYKAQSSKSSLQR